MGRYEQALLCRRGHVINEYATSQPQHNTKRCTECGAETISLCPHCEQPIRGEYQVDAVLFAVSTYQPPAFCHECGTAYPWTTERLAAAKDLAAELDGLEPGERETLARSLDDILADTPTTPVAALRVKRLLAKGRGAAVQVLRDVLVSLASEGARRLIFGG